MRARKIVMSLGRVFITMLLLQCMLHVHPAVREDNLKAFVGLALHNFGSQLSRAAHSDTAAAPLGEIGLQAIEEV